MATNKNQAKKPAHVQQAKKKPAAKNSAADSKWYIIPAAIFLLCFVLYGNSINHGYVLDDDIYTQKNEYVQKGFSEIKNVFSKGSLYGFNHVNESNYRPLVLLNFMAEVQWFGLNPHVSHFFNVLFFAICCALLYFVMLKMFKEYNKLIPLAITVLFAVHPIHTEVVANIKSRDELLAWLFGLLSFYYIFLYSENQNRKHYIISIIMFFCSILCKENSLTFILIIPLMLYFFSEFDLKKIAITSLPYLGIIGIYMLMRNSALTSTTFAEKLDVINNSLMSAKSGMDQLATEMLMMGKYLYMMVVPYPLSWDYSYNQIPVVSFGNFKSLFSVLVYLALGGYALWSFKKKSIYSFAIFFYLITIFLSSNLIVKIGASFAERFLFVPSLAFCMSLPFLLTGIFKLNSKQAVWQNKNTFYAVVGGIALIFTFILIPRNRDWQDNLTLFKSGVISAPNSARAHDALAREYRTQAELSGDPSQKGQLFGASLEEFHKALTIYQDADMYYNMGVSFYEDGLQDSALGVYEKAVALNPNYTLALNNLGVIYFNKHMYDKALQYFVGLYKSDTTNMQSLVNIGAAYQNTGNAQKAIDCYNTVLKKDPNNGNARSNMSNIYITSGMQYFNNKDYDKAYDQFTLAAQYNPNNSNAYGNMGAVMQSKGDNAKAAEYYRKALAIDPKSQLFQNQLNAVMQNQPK
jgi:tetratricopeptide (TPR) repeat protein